MKQVKVASRELTGKPLQYAALAVLGWTWALNASRRSGDGGYQKPAGYKPRWGIGQLCFIAPQFAKDLDHEAVNWAGWLLPRPNAPLAIAAFDDLREKIDLEQMITQFSIWIAPPVTLNEGPPIEVWTAGIYGVAPKPGTVAEGTSLREAVLRVIVAGTNGDAVYIPEALITPV